MLHTGERPFLCGKCGRRFARGDALIRHKKASGTCYVTFVADDKPDPNALDKQMQLPPVSLPQKKPLELEKQSQQKPQLSQPPPLGINSGSSILPSILNSTNNNSTKVRSDSSISISLPPISNPTYQTASSLSFQPQLRKPSEERSYFHASQKPQTEVGSPTSAPATPAGKDDVINGQEQPHTTISLYAQQQIHKRSSISSITSPMPGLTKPTTTPTSLASSSSSSSSSPTPTNEPSTSFSNILSSPYMRPISVVSPNFSHVVNAVQPAEQELTKVVLPSPSPTTIPSVVGNTSSVANDDNSSSDISRNNSTSNSSNSSNKSNKSNNNNSNNNNSNNNSIDNNSWQIIKMLENRVRALEERLNSSEGRVSFLENQLSALR